jgi:uncharacterized cupin superfamily protein
MGGVIRNLGEVAAFDHPRRGTELFLEREGEDWPHTGVNVIVMQPGEPNCKYHSEPDQEDFLVLHGSCLVILDGVEHALRQWDFVHCPPGTEHVFVGAGDGPCAVLMIGSRQIDRPHYPVNEVAARHGASSPVTTDDPPQAYADWPEPWREVPNPWPL